MGSKITADGDCSHEIKRCFLLGRKAMTNLDSILKSRDITLLTKICLVKAMAFLVVMYGCESWTIRKAAAAAKSLQLCPTVRRWQPTRLRHPWDSLGKNTGVGCHFLLQSMKVKSKIEVAQSCLTRNNPMDCSLPGSSVHGIFQARVLEWGATAFSIKKAERQRIDAFELWCWRRLLRVPWTARRSNQSILNKINPEYLLDGLWPFDTKS